MEIALNLAGIPGVAANFARHDTALRRRAQDVPDGGLQRRLGAGASALNVGAAAIKAVAAAPIMAVLRTLDTEATRDLLGNPFVIRFPLIAFFCRACAHACPFQPIVMNEPGAAIGADLILASAAEHGSPCDEPCVMSAATNLPAVADGQIR